MRAVVSATVTNGTIKSHFRRQQHAEEIFRVIFLSRNHVVTSSQRSGNKTSMPNFTPLRFERYAETQRQR